jgi:hypothetical protein
MTGLIQTDVAIGSGSSGGGERRRHRSLRLAARPGAVQPVRVVVDDLSSVLSAGASLEFPIVDR